MHTHEKANNSFVPPVTKSDSAGVQTRAFQITAPHTETATGASIEKADSDVQAKVNHANRAGHDLTQPYQHSSEISIQRQAEPDSKREEEEAYPIQAKLTIGQPGDKYEQEADAMAAKVMAMPDAAVVAGAGGKGKGERVQREPMLEDEEKEEKETLQAKSQIQAKGGAPAVPAGFENQLVRHKGGGQPLSDETRAFMEPRFGRDFSNVRVHETPDLANAIQAQAFTHGQDIYFNSGKYNTRSSGGKELLAHELTHTLQQSENGIQCQEHKDRKRRTYWSWYNYESNGKDYRRLKSILEKEPYNIRFLRRVKNDAGNWDKEYRPKMDTLATDVAWKVGIPLSNGKYQWSWETTETISDKCSVLAPKDPTPIEKAYSDAELHASRDPYNENILQFNRSITRSQAVEYIWQGKYSPWIEAFQPDHADQWTDEADKNKGKYKRFFLDGKNPTVYSEQNKFWSTMRDSIREQFSSKSYQREKDPFEPTQQEKLESQFPTYVSKSLIRNILSGKIFKDRNRSIVAGKSGGTQSFLYWASKTKSGSIRIAIQPLHSNSYDYYLDIANGDEHNARLLYKTLVEWWNPGMEKRIVEQLKHPNTARRELAEEAKYDLIIQILTSIGNLAPGKAGISKIEEFIQTCISLVTW